MTLAAQQTDHAPQNALPVTGFGKTFSDHMLICKFAKEKWNKPEIVPYGNLLLSPATMALHYGQSVFEGMKAFKMLDNKINIFRNRDHAKRINRSLYRMCMPQIDEELFCESIRELVSKDRNWIPDSEGSALYIRPLVFASEEKFGISVSNEYLLIVFTGPVAPYYSGDLKVKVEREFIRAAKGGTGNAKCCGNYGAAFLPTQLAQAEGYDQVIWTDAATHEYIEESGTMNLMFAIDGELISPPASDSVLDGITRNSLIQLAQIMEIRVKEHQLSVSELLNAFAGETITEAFGVGTAAVVSRISQINIDGMDYMLPENQTGSIMCALKTTLEDMRRGRTDDIFRWNDVIS
jgi:branched-chain amino acid aminotransferase